MRLGELAINEWTLIGITNPRFAMVGDEIIDDDWILWRSVEPPLRMAVGKDDGSMLIELPLWRINELIRANGGRVQAAKRPRKMMENKRLDVRRMIFYGKPKDETSCKLVEYLWELLTEITEIARHEAIRGRVEGTEEHRERYEREWKRCVALAIEHFLTKYSKN